MSSSDPDSDSDPGPDGPQNVNANITSVGRDKKSKYRTPQESIDRFWGKFMTKTPGRVTAIIPPNEFGEKRAKKGPKARSAAAQAGQVGGGLTTYEEAAAICKAKVAQIVKECRRVNQKYRDPHFDLEFDLKLGRRDCLDSLDNRKDKNKRKEPDNRDKMGGKTTTDVPAAPHGSATWPTMAGTGIGTGGADERGPPRRNIPGEEDDTFYPRSVKRVTDIFERPEFYVDGPTANDVRQGRDGDCWLMAALCTMGNKPGLIERVCVARDQAVGVYGFVFHRDGQFFSEIIDDKLYLTKPDYDEGYLERILWEDRERVNSEETYRKTYQTNSGALYFAQCENPNETWLPLLEKAYAKAHGDYSAIEGGFTGEGLEDLTGGVTSEIYTTDILDKEHFWKEELLKVNETFLFGCSTGVWGLGWGQRKGIVELHAYSVMRAVEIDDKRLVLLKNPWGKGEWTGPWSDGSKEWTPEWLQKLDHRFGDDGSFWIEYSDLLQKYQAFDRTRLFDTKEWSMAAAWASFPVPWATTTAALGYSRTKFRVGLKRAGPVVIVLSQLDERYFVGLEGQYRFELSFRVHKFSSGGERGSGDDSDNDDDDDDYIVRSRTAYRMNRSVNVELDLEAGEYTVLVKIEAQRNDDVMPPEEVVRANAKNRREKLLRVGLAYDLAHAKARLTPEEEAEEKAARKAHVQRKKNKERQKLKEDVMEGRRREHYLDTRDLIRKRKKAEKTKKKKAAKKEKKKLEAEKREAEKREAEKREAEKREAEKREAEAKGKTEAKQTEEQSVKERKAETGQDRVADPEQAPPKDKLPEESKTKEATDGGEEKKAVEAEVPQTKSKNIADEFLASVEQTESRSAADSVTDESIGAAILTPPTPQIEPKDESPQASEDSKKEATEKDSQSQEPTTPPARAPSDQHTQTSPSTVTASPAPEATEPSSVAKTRKNKPERVDKAVQVPDRSRSPRHHDHERYYSSRSPSPAPRHHHSHSHRRYPHSPAHLPPFHPSFLPQRATRRPSHSLSPMGGIPPPPPPPVDQRNNNSSEDDDDDSDLDSISSVSDISDRELDILADNRKRMQAAQIPPAPVPAPPPPPPGIAGTSSDGEDDGKDPWNAVAVIGLRVYYKKASDGEDKDGVRIKVVRPSKYAVSDSEETKGKEADKADGEDVLDVDDSAKDATLEGVVPEGGEQTALEREAHKELEKEEEQVEDKSENQAENKSEKQEEEKKVQPEDKKEEHTEEKNETEGEKKDQ